jgi:DNA-binding response OmpR family regulator
MVSGGERILIVENDPDISDQIARQALKPLGYQTQTAAEATIALRLAMQEPPDLVIADLSLPDLSGADLLTALASQGIGAPVVVVAERGQEQRVIQAFRLGAVDALFWPARDAEIVRVVERALQQVRSIRARKELDEELVSARSELERKVRDLTAILSISRAVISVTDQRQLLGRLLEAALQVAQADMAWLMLRDEASKVYFLKAYRNLPAAWAKKLDQPLDDGLSSMVAVSGQSLIIHGVPLEKFKVSTLGKSAAVLPVKIHEEIIGLLMVIRKADVEIDKNMQILLEAVADFASISLVNSRLFRAVELSAEAAKLSEQKRRTVLGSLRVSIRDEVRVSMSAMETLTAGESGTFNEEQVQAAAAVRNSLKRLARLAERLIPDTDQT